MDALRAAISKYCDNDTFSDFVIVCGSKEYKVHRVIISIHSKYFERCCAGGFSESEAHRVELKEDHEEAVGAMIKYFYSLEYDDSKTQDDVDNSMQLNARVYAVADKYEVLGLKQLAIEKFKKAAKQSLTEDAAILQAVETIYKKIALPKDDRAFKDIVVHAWLYLVSIYRDVEEEKMKEMLMGNPEFLYDVHLQLISGIKRLPDSSLELGCRRCEFVSRIDEEEEGEQFNCEQCGDPVQLGDDMTVSGLKVTLKGPL